MASKCKCGNTDSYNFALNIGLCNPCIGERLEELEAQLKWHKEIKLELEAELHKFREQALNS